MNKRQIVASLNKIANELDSNGLHKEASSVTNVMKRIAIIYTGESRTIDETIQTFKEHILLNEN